MKFKHAFNLLVDNFSVTYKQLLYRLIIIVIGGIIGWFVITPFMKDFINSAAMDSLFSNVHDFVIGLLEGNMEVVSNASNMIVDSYDQLIKLFETRIWEVILTGLVLLALYIVERWFSGLGNYTTAVLINNKMALRTESSFIRTLISHFREAALYNLIYVPLSILYDVIIAAGLLAVMFFMVHGIQLFLVSVFIFALIMVLAIALKMTFTCDWLPALIRGKMGQKKAIAYTFSRKNKSTINIFSNFIVLIVIILAMNVMAVLFTFGVGFLLTFPASYVMLICFEMVVYYDREELRYFVDRNTVIKPDKESVLTREQFFRGTDTDEEP